MFDNVIDLSDWSRELPGPVAAARDRFQGEHPGEGHGFPSKFDYRRYALAYERVVPSESVLDVGVGSGQLINALAMGRACQTVYGIDVRWHSRFTRFHEEFELRQMDVAKMDTFVDDQFDSALCMEVLEHLEPEALTRALVELRRVTRERLVMTVPYCEPEPLPTFHKTRFGDEELRTFFPDACFSLLRKPRVSWVLVEELPGKAHERF